MRIYEGRRVRVEVFSHILPNGRSIKAERVLFPPVVSVLLELNGSVVLLRQYRPALGAYHLEVPSGVVEEGETPVAVAARELEEEAGLKAARLDPLFEGVVSPGYSTEYSYVFLAEEPEKTQPRREEHESIETVEIPLEEAFDMLRDGRIRDMRTALALSQYFMVKNFHHEVGFAMHFHGQASPRRQARGDLYGLATSTEGPRLRRHKRAPAGAPGLAEAAEERLGGLKAAGLVEVCLDPALGRAHLYSLAFDSF